MSRPTIGITLPNAAAFRSQKYRNYLTLIEEGGGDPLPIVPGFVVDFEQIDALVLSGGGDINPKHYGEAINGTREHEILDMRDDTEFQLLKQAVEAHIPIMGICRGMQMINIYFGGNMHQDINGMGKTIHSANGSGYSRHPVNLIPGTLIHEIIGKDRIEVMSSHHQAVNELGKELQISGMAEDEIVEAIESTNSMFIIGVQWHPEADIDENSLKLIKALIDAALKN